MIKQYIKTGHKKYGEMNITEDRFYKEQLLLKKANFIIDIEFQPITFNLAKGLKYTPDFMITEKDLTIKFIEIKGGYITDKGLNKFKMICDKFSNFKFEMVQYKNKQFKTIREN